MQALDRGVLNVPLAKRGKDIDAQLDAYKAQQASDRKAAAKEAAKVNAALRVQAKAVLAAMSDEQVARIAAKASITVTQARKQLASIAYFTPRRVIALAA
jgi:hypothetical protein